MRANLLKCDEGRLNSYMIKSCSKYFGKIEDQSSYLIVVLVGKDVI